jgi:DNA-binding winged helix-turn-helix (wHTH) protein
VLSSRELLGAVWGPRVVEPDALAAAIRRIRTALADEHANIIRPCS